MMLQVIHTQDLQDISTNANPSPAKARPQATKSCAIFFVINAPLSSWVPQILRS